MKRIFFAVLLISLSACGGSDVYRKEDFGKSHAFQRNFAASADAACAAAEFVLLGRGYLLERKAQGEFFARKEFQPEKEANVTIDFSVVCRDLASGSVVFASAIETRNELKKTTQSASIGIPAAGSISLPWSNNAEALIKVRGKTIEDEKFYSGFFDAVGSRLGK